MVRLFSVLLFVSIVASSVYFVLNKNNFDLTSPIPKVFGVSKRALPSNNWFPKETSFSSSLPKINISADSAVVVDYDTGKIIFSKNSSHKQPVASTVKIMTALVALENSGLGRQYTVSDHAAHIGDNVMGLTTGEKLTLSELLSGLILVSGNDAAVAIAENVAEDEGKFVAMMNKRAAEIGMRDTRFINSSGLDEDNSEQYSTAYDMAILAHYIWENHPEFVQISSTYHKFIDSTDIHKSFDLYNDTNLLTTYPGVRGIKPGFTWEAKLCLVTYAENDGKRLIAVILGSDDRRGEMKELLDYGFGYFGIKVPHPALD